MKDFTAEHARDEVEFYMGMVADDQQTFKGPIKHLKNAFQSRGNNKQTDKQFLCKGPKEE